KKLEKRYPQISNDLAEFTKTIYSKDDLGTSLGNNIYKARIKNSDKNRGKSGGYRLITLLKVIENEVYLLFIYDKSDFENINDSDILELIEAASIL
ncbi:MAG TPA: type II toxin-antitoxin system RelE/ParE family toxin, partial [Campylobacterales bacterium]|nr:type II toxin-antitoxin system RelE/ParE family toxin [Campylobacterales bacterium]